jgi:hypothetical protein
MPMSRPRPSPAATLAALAVLAVAAGCQKPLFPENAPRTQFEKFDTMRSGAAPTEEPDVFGATQPALRARLTPQTQND